MPSTTAERTPVLAREDELALLRSYASKPNGPEAEALEEVIDFLSAGVLGSWIGGADHQSDSVFSVVDPATGSELVQASDGGASSVEAAVQAARAALPEWKALSGVKRGELLWAIADAVEAKGEVLAVLEALDTGKALWETRLVDIPLTVNHFRYFAGWASKAEGLTMPLTDTAMLTYSRREPLGVVGGIIPWNYPLVFAAYRIAAPIGYGNTTIVKPAEQAPLTTLYLARLISELGVPAGVVNVVLGEGDTGAALVAHKGVAKIAFTGSVETGQIVARSAADTLKNVSLELGGKSANIIFADAPVADAVNGALNGIFFSQGQVCTAGSRLFLEASVRDEIVAGMKEGLDAHVIGHPLDPDTTMGPLVSAEQLDRVNGFVEQGSGEGDVAIYTRTLDLPEELQGGYFFPPMIFDVKQTDGVLGCEEIFGPVVGVQTFTDEDDVVERANATDFGLANGVWTTNLSRAHTVAARLESGTVWVNTYNMFDAAAPIGGFKQSGVGRELGSSSLELYTHAKTVWINTAVR